MMIRKRQRRKPLIPINSMSDIAFLLLIFIMLLSLINYKREIKIEYAEAKNQESTQRDKNFEVWVDKVGTAFYKGRMVNIDELKKLAEEKYDKYPDLRFHIIADKNVKYKKVNRIIELFKDIQVNAVSLVVRENK
jgi:biopolymer transport protein ExbD